MMRTGSAPAIAMVLAASATMICAQPGPPSTSAPATRATIDVDLSGAQVIDLWPAGALKDEPAENTEVIKERVDALGRHDRSVSKISHPNLTRIPLRDAKSPTAAVILIPGGGYGGEVFDREGYFPADQLRAAGIAAFVLKYRLPNAVPPTAGEQPVPLQDVARAIRLVRAHAAEWSIDPKRIGVMGFSAGGHVAGMAATLFDAGDASAADPIARESSRPDFAVLMYAVSSMHPELAHAGSRRALLGPTTNPALDEQYSTAHNITANTPPLLIVHAKDDKIVKFENSVEVDAAATKAGVPHEFITFETGGHGFGIGAPGSEEENWLSRFYAWLAKLR